MKSGLVGASVAAALAMCPSGLARQGVTSQVALNSREQQGNFVTGWATVSRDGRFVAFESWASNLVAGDTNWTEDIFVRDLWDGVTERVSVSSTGAQSSGSSYRPVISADGRYVAFVSDGNDLVPLDNNSAYDVFLRDRVTGTVERVSIDSAGNEANGSSPYVAMSRDARFVIFPSGATNLDSLPDTNGATDVFVRDRASGTTERVSVDSAGTVGNQESGTWSGTKITDDGRWVLFFSDSTNLVPGDTNDIRDVFVHDRTTGATARVSVSSSGVQGNDESADGSIATDGRYVAFLSYATNLVPGDTNADQDIFVRDLQAQTTERVSVATSGAQGLGGCATMPWISADGRFVAFCSSATNLGIDANGLADIFVRDRLAHVTELISVNALGGPANDQSLFPVISADGRFVVFVSYATDLVPFDAHAGGEAFIRDRWSTTPIAYCAAKVNSAGCTPRVVWSGLPSVSSAAPFVIGASDVLDAHTGVLFFGVAGPHDAPMQGGTLCMRQPLRRTPIQNAPATGVPPCAGSYAFDFNAQIASGVDAILLAGTRVYAQYWMRDAAASYGIGLSDAITFVIGN